MGTIRDKSLTRLVLTTLEKAVDGYVRLEDFANNPGFYAYYDGWQRPLKKSSLAVAIKRLRDKGFIVQERIGNAAILVDPYSTASIYKSLTQIYGPKQQEKLRNLGFEQIKKFSWEKAAKETLKIFKSLK